jgi:hypothetical protein
VSEIAPTGHDALDVTIAAPGRRTGRRGRTLLLALVGLLATAIIGPNTSVVITTVWAQESTEKVFDLKIERGRVAQNLRRLRVTQGDDVRLRVTSDTPTVLHLHGYDIEKKVVPGEVTEFQFKARAAGRFSLSIHGHGSSHHHDPLLVLEVHPR